MQNPDPAIPSVHYRVEAADLHAHLFKITLTVTPANAQQVLRLPVWIPGSYLVREFSKNLQNLRTRQGRRTLNMVQIDPLLGVFEPILHQIPYPDGPVREDQHGLGGEQAALERLGVQLSLKTADAPAGCDKAPIRNDRSA